LLFIFLANHGKQVERTNGVWEMMRKAAVKKNAVYTIDLTKIDGDGAFACPNCGTVISPDDESEETYHILETKVKNDDLEELVLTCKKCGTTIRLVGFLSQPEN
jgi:ribosomal protein S27AE